MHSMIVRCAVASILLFGAASAHAGPILNVSANASAGVSGNPSDSDTEASSGVMSAGASASASLSAPITTTSNFFVSGNAVGNAFPGILSASAQGLVQSTHTGTLAFLGLSPIAGGTGNAVADFLIDDLIVTGGSGATTVPLSLWLDLTGSLGAGVSLNSGVETLVGAPATVGGTATVGVHVQAGGATFEGTRSFSSNDQHPEVIGSTGLLAGGDLFDTPSFDVLVGSPFSLLVRLSVSAGASTNITHGNAIANASFLSTLRFPLDHPVFDLPDGYTVNSLSAGIVDNRVGGVAGVPEPASFLLFGAGLAWLIATRRRNQRQ